MKAINDGGFVDTPYPIEDSLFFKIQGDSDVIQLTSQAIRQIVRAHGSSNFEFAATVQAAEEMWRNRKYALHSALAAMPGYRYWVTDVWYALTFFQNFVRPYSCLPVCQFPNCRSLFMKRRKIWQRLV